MQSILTDTKHFLVLIRKSNPNAICSENPDNRAALSTRLKNYTMIPGCSSCLSEFNNIRCEQDTGTFYAVSLLHETLQSNPTFLNIIQKHLSQQLLNFLCSPDFLTDAAKWMSYAREVPEEWMGALDAIDEALEREDKWVVAMYAGIDHLAKYESNFTLLIRTLLQFWMAQNQRWVRIKAKILIPEELFCSEMSAFQDGAKLSSYTSKFVERSTS